MTTLALLALAIGMSPDMLQPQTYATFTEWETSPAYFVDASPESRAEMRDGVDSLVVMIVCPNWTSADWICTKQGWRFFQGVSGLGASMKRGYGCVAAEIPYQHYYSEHMLRKSRCVALVWYEESRRYSVNFLEDTKQ